MSYKRRWYDRDPLLKEALELLSISTDNTKDEAARFMLNLQEEVAADVIEKLYEQLQTFEGKGNRWYDSDPVMMRGIELLRVAPPHVQRVAAKKLLTALAQDSFDGLSPDFEE